MLLGAPGLGTKGIPTSSKKLETNLDHRSKSPEMPKISPFSVQCINIYEYNMSLSYALCHVSNTNSAWSMCHTCRLSRASWKPGRPGHVESIATQSTRFFGSLGAEIKTGSNGSNKCQATRNKCLTSSNKKAIRIKNNSFFLLLARHL